MRPWLIMIALSNLPKCETCTLKYLAGGALASSHIKGRLERSLSLQNSLFAQLIYSFARLTFNSNFHSPSFQVPLSFQTHNVRLQLDRSCRLRQLCTGCTPRSRLWLSLAFLAQDQLPSQATSRLPWSPCPNGFQARLCRFGRRCPELHLLCCRYLCQRWYVFTPISDPHDAYASFDPGAVAKLYDISCLQGNSIFATIQDKAVGTSDRGLSLIEGALAGSSDSSSITNHNNLTVVDTGTTIFMGDHYFVTNPTGAGGISPEFDFRTGAKKGDPNGFVIVKKNLGVAAPNPANVDLLALDALPGFGTLGKHVYRMDTALGQPAKSCTAGATSSVKYAAKYCKYSLVLATPSKTLHTLFRRLRLVDTYSLPLHPHPPQCGKRVTHPAHFTTRRPICLPFVESVRGLLKRFTLGLVKRNRIPYCAKP